MPTAAEPVNVTPAVWACETSASPASRPLPDR